MTKLDTTDVSKTPSREISLGFRGATNVISPAILAIRQHPLHPKFDIQVRKILRQI